MDIPRFDWIVRGGPYAAFCIETNERRAFHHAGEEEIKDVATGKVRAANVRALNRRDSAHDNVYIGEHDSE